MIGGILAVGVACCWFVASIESFLDGVPGGEVGMHLFLMRRLVGGLAFLSPEAGLSR